MTSTQPDPEPEGPPVELQLTEIEVQPSDPDATFGATAAVGIPNVVRLTIRAGHDVRLNAPGGVTRTATAIALAGSGTIRSQQAPNPHQNLKAGGGSKSVKGKIVVLRAITPTMVVDILFN